MSRHVRAFPLAALLLMALLLPGCGQVPDAVPPGEYAPPTQESYPRVPTVDRNTTQPHRPTRTPEATQAPTSEPTALPAPILQVQAVPSELREGERIAFLRDGDLWVAQPNGNIASPITISGNATAFYGWSHDCSRLLLGVGDRSSMPEGDMIGGKDLWVLWADGSTSQPWTTGWEVLFADWSPTTDQVVYLKSDSHLYLVESNTPSQPLSFADVPAVLAAWSPGNSQVALLLPDSQTWGQSLAVMDLSSRKIRQLTDSALHSWGDGNVLWSLDGQHILFQSNREESHGWARWWMIDETGENLHLLDNGKLQEMVTSAQRPSRSPTVDQVVFGHYRFSTDVPTIWVMDLDGGNLRELTKGTNPAWSPDGNRVAYAGPNGGLWIINLDGTGNMQIVEQGSNPLWYWPDWCR